MNSARDSADTGHGSASVLPEATTGCQDGESKLLLGIGRSEEKREAVDDVPVGTGEEVKEEKKDLFFKTSLCSYFRKLGSCRHGDNCRYAHGDTELRPRPDGSWDPTSVRGRSAQKRERELPKEEEEEEEEDAEQEEDGGASLRKCIRDLPLRWTSEDLKKLLADEGVAFRTSKKRKRSPVGFIEFESDEHMVLAKQKLDGLSVHSKILKVVDALPRAWDNKNIQEVSADGHRLNEAATKCVERLDICDVVTPLAKLPYKQQLDKKSAEVSQVLKKLVRNVRKAISQDVPLPQWVVSARLQGGLSCPFDGVIESPVVDGYRNKCEFTIGYSLDGTRVVGFLLGNFREGCNYVMEPDQCQNVSSNARAFAKAFQKFVQDSELPVWDKVTNAGFWRLFTVREGRAASTTSSIAEVMLIVQVCSSGVDESIRTKEYNRMAHELAMSASQACPRLPLSALMVQDHLGISNAASPDSPLMSLSIPQVEEDSTIHQTDKDVQNFIHDYICNLRFRISPTAFFQVNTLAAEKLYSLAGDWAGLDSHTLLFDVCCGTGTIGLTLAHRVGMVIGIEMNDAAVADAHTNAEINGIKNCRFVCGKAEDVMNSLLEEYLLKEDSLEEEASVKSNAEVLPNSSPKELPGLDLFPEKDRSRGISCASNGKFTSVVVLVDPPRSGLHPVVVKLLRTHEQIRRLVYVSCNPETLLANAVELCTPIGAADHGKGAAQKGPWRRTVVGHARQRVKSMPVSNPFSPIRAVAVDMFPHTPHCEVVMLMER